MEITSVHPRRVNCPMIGEDGYLAYYNQYAGHMFVKTYEAIQGRPRNIEHAHIW